jgi:curved DNA-binding protein CbpA
MSSYVHRRGGRDPHDVLGVPRGADRQQVMRAFHRKVRRGGHPDTGGDAQTFEEIVRARDVLLNQARLAASESDRRAAQATRAPNANSSPLTLRKGRRAGWRYSRWCSPRPRSRLYRERRMTATWFDVAARRHCATHVHVTVQGGRMSDEMVTFVTIIEVEPRRLT